MKVWTVTREGGYDMGVGGNAQAAIAMAIRQLRYENEGCRIRWSIPASHGAGVKITARGVDENGREGALDSMVVEEHVVDQHGMVSDLAVMRATVAICDELFPEDNAEPEEQVPLMDETAPVPPPENLSL